MSSDGRELLGPEKCIVDWDVNHGEGQVVKMKALSRQEFKDSHKQLSYTCVGDRHRFYNVGILKVEPGLVPTPTMESQEGIVAVPKPCSLGGVA